VALISGVREDRRLRSLALAFGVALAGVLASVVTDRWFLRFTLFFPAVLALATAKLCSLHPRLTPIAWACAGALFVGTNVPDEMPVQGLAELMAQPWQSRQAVLYPGTPAQGGGLVCVVWPGHKVYAFHAPDFNRRVIYVRRGTADDLIRLMKAESITSAYGAGTHPILRECVERGLLKRGIGYFFELP